VRAVYLLGPLAATACFYFVWRLARELLEPAAALIAVLALEGLHYFNFSAVKFDHDTMQLPFWALAGWLAYRAIAADRARDWIGAGAALALAFWSKYAALALGFPILLFLVFDAKARPRWRGPGRYLMAAAFLALLAPNIWWPVHSGFQPLRYVDQRAVVASRWYDYLWFPVRRTGSQILALLPVAALLAHWVVVALLAWPIAYGAIELGEPFLRDRPRRPNSPAARWRR
jgi:4-amino-4-deoxy-L-arabinose transferase-like glycosyltransferase